MSDNSDTHIHTKEHTYQGSLIVQQHTNLMVQFTVTSISPPAWTSVQYMDMHAPCLQMFTCTIQHNWDDLFVTKTDVTKIVFASKIANHDYTRMTFQYISFNGLYSLHSWNHGADSVACLTWCKDLLVCCNFLSSNMKGNNKLMIVLP